jgi:hypothetical protein
MVEPLFVAQTKSQTSLSWNATVAALALEKLRQGKIIADDEVAAIRDVSEELEALSRASQVSIASLVRGKSENLSPIVRESFFTLVALERAAPEPLDAGSFGELGNDLAGILEMLVQDLPVKPDLEVLGRAQERCFDLLDQLAGRSPRR